MRRLVLCLGLFLAGPLAGRAAESEEPASIEFSAGAWVDVDATGKAHVVEMDRSGRLEDDGKAASLVDVINARLRGRIESWQFDPPTKNGVAVSGRTHVDMTVLAEDDGSGDIRLRVKQAHTGLVMKQRPSFMPLVFEMGGASGWKLLFHLEIDPEGHVTDARIVDSRIFDGKEFVARRSTYDLTRVALRTVRQLEFEMEQVDGQPIAGNGALPVRLCMSGSAACNDPISDEGDEGDASQVEFAAANPAIGLRTDVANMLL